jgi:hypothetical protein
MDARWLQGQIRQPFRPLDGLFVDFLFHVHYPKDNDVVLFSVRAILEKMHTALWPGATWYLTNRV